MIVQSMGGKSRQEQAGPIPQSGAGRRNRRSISWRVALSFVVVLNIFFTNTAAFSQKSEQSACIKPAGPVSPEASPASLGKPVRPEDGKEINTIAGLSDGRISADARLYILAVGINEYKNPKYTLKYGRPDAEAFVQALEQHGKNIFRQIVKQTIYDSQATRENMENVFNGIIAEARPEDAFVFYYAGHGVMSGGDASRRPEFYLALTDVTKLYGDNKLLEERGVSARLLRDFIIRIKAQKQLVVLDTCHAGGALESFAMRGAAEEKAAPRMPKNAGLTILAATGTWQSATEFRQLGHGVFTYALLKGLAGEADNGESPDGTITVKKLEAYLNSKVPELIKQFRGKAQNPNSFARGQDFPIGAR